MKKEQILEVYTHNNVLLKVDETYTIDKKYRNSGKVKLVQIYGQYFCRVRDEETGGEWDTMLNRLSID